MTSSASPRRSSAVRVGLAAALCAIATVPALTAGASTASAATAAVYVSPSGSDAGDGTSAHPYLSIAKGLSAARPGGTVFLAGGVYEQRVVNPSVTAGTATAPITVTNAPGEKPVIKGLLWLSNASFWRIQGIGVTWSAKDSANEHMVKMSGGTGWSLEGSELWGAHSYAALLVAGSASSWRVANNYIHDTAASNGTNQDHLIYVNSRGAGGVVEGNVLENSPNGRAIKVGPPSQGAGAVSGLTIRYNTMKNNTGPSNVQLAWETSHVDIYRNIMTKPATGRSAVTAYQLTGTGNVVRDNVAWLAPRVLDTGVSGLSDGQGNRLADPATLTGYGAAASRSAATATSATPPVATSPVPTPPVPAPSTTPAGPVLRGTSRAAVTARTSLTVARPSGTAAGDVLVAAVTVRGRLQATAPAGWALLRTDAVSTTMAQALYTKVAKATEPASWTWTLASAASATVHALAYSGSTAPAAAAGATGSGATATAPGASSPAAGILVGFFSSAKATTVAPSDGATSQSITAQGTYSVSSAGSQRRVDAVTGTRGLSASTGTSTWIGQSVLLH